MKKRKRAPRTTKKQLEVIVQILEDNPNLIELKVNPGDIENVKQKWNEVVDILNNKTDGSSKTLTQWKSVISEFKTNVRRKARDIYLSKKATGGGPPPKELNETEEKLYALLSPVSIEGARGVPEPGIGVLPDNNITFEAFEPSNEGLPSIIGEENTEDTELLEPENEETERRPTRSRTQRTKPRTYKKMSTSVQVCLERQTKSTEEMAKSISILASSIEKLATSLNGLTVAVNNFIDEIG